MSDVDDLLIAGLKSLPLKPGDGAKQSGKKRYSEEMSEVVAAAFAQALRNRNLRETLPGAAMVPGKRGTGVRCRSADRSGGCLEA
jgi:hypothetical protein